MSAGVLLINPKKDYNVGAVVRACAVFGAEICAWTGTRVKGVGVNGMPTGYRLPREERLKGYEHVRKVWMPRLADDDFAALWGMTPVAVEVRENAELLPDFIHPEYPLYIFGPEDGTLGKSWLEFAHRFLVIPTAIRSPLNLAAAANLVLYDRHVKLRAREDWERDYERLAARARG